MLPLLMNLDMLGIGLAEEEPGISLATPVDFVISDGRSFPTAIGPRPGNIINLETRRAVKRESAELREMIEMYALWRRAA